MSTKSKPKGIEKRYLVEVLYPMSQGGASLEAQFEHWLAAQRFADAHKDEGAQTYVWDTEQD